MKEKEKKMIGILILITIVVITIFLISKNNSNDKNNSEIKNDIVQENKEEYVQVLDDGTKLNTSTKLNEIKTVNGMQIGNIQLTTTNGETTLLADVKNNTGKDIGLTAIDIILYNKNGEELVKFGGVIGNVKAGETVKLQSSTTLDFANAYDFKVVIK